VSCKLNFICNLEETRSLKLCLLESHASALRPLYYVCVLSACNTVSLEIKFCIARSPVSKRKLMVKVLEVCDSGADITSHTHTHASCVPVWPIVGHYGARGMLGEFLISSAHRRLPTLCNSSRSISGGNVEHSCRALQHRWKDCLQTVYCS
jgi:hypothetical protein